MGRPITPEKKLNLSNDEEEDDSYVATFNNNRIIYLTGTIDENPVSNVIASLFSLLKKDSKKPINLVISTYGGSIYDMLGLYDAISYVKSVGCPVHTIGLAKIMSAGVLLLACGSHGHRLVGEHTSIMYHLGKDEIHGDMFEISNGLKELERIDILVNKLLSKHTNMSIEQIDELLKERQDVYITAEEAIKMGIADKILGK